MTTPNDGGACCAHCKVELKHNEYPGGRRSDYWECSDCGKRFYPEVVDMNIRNLRDFFAGMALQGLLACPETAMNPDPTIAQIAYSQATAMIAERNKKP